MKCTRRRPLLHRFRVLSHADSLNAATRPMKLTTNRHSDSRHITLRHGRYRTWAPRYRGTFVKEKSP